jgi:hypothetical protein
MKMQILKLAIPFMLMTCLLWSCDKQNQDVSEKTKWTIFDVSNGLISNPVNSINKLFKTINPFILQFTTS